jgi:hypothetical protein
MDQRPRLSVVRLSKTAIPEKPGVYAFYRDNQRVYVGLAGKQFLRDRIWKNHCSRGLSLTNSALRRKIAEHLKIASSADIKTRRYRPSLDDILRVRRWFDACEATWIDCDSPETAKRYEASMKAECLPLLTKR